MMNEIVSRKLEVITIDYDSDYDDEYYWEK